jgi:hypothetical protein
VRKCPSEGWGAGKSRPPGGLKRTLESGLEAALRRRGEEALGAIPQLERREPWAK